MEIFREIENLERELVDPKIRKDIGRIQERLFDEFVEFGSSGRVILKSDVIADANQSRMSTYQLSDFRFKLLGDSHILVAYSSVVSPSQQVALRSSIWISENGRWQMLHHQATVVPDSI